MSSILEALYEGDICPAERFQRNAFDDLLNRQFQAIPVEYAAVFAEGFRMGARMMLEIWDTKSF